jgi:hypothetical protein
MELNKEKKMKSEQAVLPNPRRRRRRRRSYLNKSLIFFEDLLLHNI